MMRSERDARYGGLGSHRFRANLTRLIQRLFQPLVANGGGAVNLPISRPRQWHVRMDRFGISSGMSTCTSVFRSVYVLKMPWTSHCRTWTSRYFDPQLVNASRNVTFTAMMVRFSLAGLFSCRRKLARELVTKRKQKRPVLSMIILRRSICLGEKNW